MNSGHVERLVESRTTRIDLAPDQYDAILRLSRDLAGTVSYWGGEEEAGRVMSARPSSSGGYDVRVENAVGVIGLPRMTLEVVPKIPPAHFNALARMALPQLRMDASTANLGDGSFVELLFARFIAELGTALRRGPYRDYVPQVKWRQSIRGKIRLPESATRWLMGDMGVLSEADEFDIDNALNRQLAAALAVVRRLSASDLTARRAASLAAEFDGVGPVGRVDLTVRLDRSARGYEAASDLARLILGSGALSLSVGHRAGQSVLLPTPQLVEDGIREILRRGLAPLKVEKRGRALPPSSLTVNPDLVIGGGAATGDVKYKILSTMWNRGDLAQAVLFAEAFRAPNGILIAFEADASPAEREIHVGDVVVHLATWTLREGADAASEALVARVGDILRTGASNALGTLDP